MPANFGTGLKRVVAQTEPRFVLAYGNASKLRTKLLSEILNRTECEVHQVASDLWLEAFTLPLRPSKDKLIVVDSPERFDWSPLKLWLDKAKPSRMIMQTGDEKFADTLSKIVKTRGLVIECDPSDKVLEQYFKDNYGLTQVQTRIVMEKYLNNIDAAIDVLDKCKLLNVKYSIDNANFFGSPLLKVERFIHALLNNRKNEAYVAARNINLEDIPGIINTLEQKLDLLSKLHGALVGTKTVSEVASEVGTTRAIVTEWSGLARKYGEKSLIRASFALANVDKYGLHDGVLEVLVATW